MKWRGKSWSKRHIQTENREGNEAVQKMRKQEIVKRQGNQETT